MIFNSYATKVQKLMEFLQHEKRAEYCIEALNLLAYSIKMNSDKSEDSIRKSIIFLQ